MLVCPGCGARNDATSRICEWCGRPFIDERPRFPYSWAAPIALAGLVVLVGLTVMISLLGAMLLPVRNAESPAAAPPPNTPTLEIQRSNPAVSVVPERSPVALAVPTETMDPSPSPPPLPSPTEPAVEPVEFVLVGNTDRQGAFIRREPRAGAPGIVAHRDGTLLKVVGPDTQVDGRAWRNVEDQRGNRGWTPRDYLLPSATGF